MKNFLDYNKLSNRKPFSVKIHRKKIHKKNRAKQKLKI
jgi:hypothetical protein